MKKQKKIKSIITILLLIAITYGGYTVNTWRIFYKENQNIKSELVNVTNDNKALKELLANKDKTIFESKKALLEMSNDFLKELKDTNQQLKRYQEENEIFISFIENQSNKLDIKNKEYEKIINQLEKLK